MISWRIPMETRREIAALSPTLSSRAVGERFGIDKRTVLNIRREFGVRIPSRGGERIWGKAMRVAAVGNPLRLWPIRPRGRRPLTWAMEGSA